MLGGAVGGGSDLFQFTSGRRSLLPGFVNRTVLDIVVFRVVFRLADHSIDFDAEQ